MKNELLRKLPRIDYLLNHKDLKEYGEKIDYYTFSNSIKKGVEFFRLEILEGKISLAKEFEEKDIINKIKEILKKDTDYNLKKVINGTGVIIHTNLGRSIISKDICSHAFDIMSSYSNLEYDIEIGKRSTRTSHLENLICEITGAESALVVNNNAAAVVLLLNEFAKGKETIISRGELVEIGGSFRIPEIMKFAGTSLIEVGTTNKTYISDYEEAITENTSVLMKVHTSNYKINGFTHEAKREEIKNLANNKNLVSIEDLGSGVLIDLSKYGIKKETTVQEVIKSGIDLVTFSGDKLLGGCQAGIIVGKKNLIDRLKKNQYLRTVRVDKITIAILENIFKIYHTEKEAIEKIPTLKYITENIEETRRRAEELSLILNKENIKNNIIETEASVGGGSLPEETIKSFGIEFNLSLPSHEIEKKLRMATTPIIGRITKDKYILDMKTIEEDDILYLSKIIISTLKDKIFGDEYL